jgi:hypothetical protein
MTEIEKMKERLIDCIKEQAKLFLEEMGEFYPFGTSIDKNNDLRPLSVHMDEEIPDVGEMLLKLEKGINFHLLNGEFILAAICIEIFINNNKGKIDAIQIRILDKNNQIGTYNYPYKIDNKNVVIDKDAYQMD